MIAAPYRKSRNISFGSTSVGGEKFTVIAGPCSIESYDQFLEVAKGVKRSGAAALRGGIFKMRSHPDSFQGLGAEAFEIAQRVRRETGMAVVTEITDSSQLATLGEVVDVFQVGARNMHNTELLRALGRAGKPVLLKRALSGYLSELLWAAEYVIRAGNPEVILCERGIRTYERAMRNTLDLAAVPYLKARSELPVIVDPSHATGMSELVAPMCLAAAAAGADGLLVEVHARPEVAASDAEQALDLENFGRMMSGLKRVLSAVDRSLETF